MGFAQLTCVSQAVPHVWHFAMTSSVMRSAMRSSKTSFPNELVSQALFLRLSGVLDDASFQLMHILEPFVLEVGLAFSIGCRQCNT